jgi:hypothetical protein
MSKKDPSSRRSPRRRPAADVALPLRPLRKIQEEPLDFDFGLALALVPALRRRPND